jgi:hypothetical protein
VAKTKHKKFDPYTGRTDCEKLVRYMALRGALTRVHAEKEFGNGGSITARIADLRLRHGYYIHTERCVDERGRGFSKWSLNDQQQVVHLLEIIECERRAFESPLLFRKAA